MSPEQIQSLLCLAIGFAFAGVLASGFQLLTARQASFGLLNASPYAAALAAVPLICFAAPFIIMRNAVAGIRTHHPRGFQFTFFATLIAGFWSLMSGNVVLMALQASGIFA